MDKIITTEPGLFSDGDKFWRLNRKLTSNDVTFERAHRDTGTQVEAVLEMYINEDTLRQLGEDIGIPWEEVPDKLLGRHYWKPTYPYSRETLDSLAYRVQKGRRFTAEQANELRAKRVAEKWEILRDRVDWVEAMKTALASINDTLSGNVWAVSKRTVEDAERWAATRAAKFVGEKHGVGNELQTEIDVLAEQIRAARLERETLLLEQDEKRRQYALDHLDEWVDSVAPEVVDVIRQRLQKPTQREDHIFGGF